MFAAIAYDSDLTSKADDTYMFKIKSFAHLPENCHTIWIDVNEREVADLTNEHQTAFVHKSIKNPEEVRVLEFVMKNIENIVETLNAPVGSALLMTPYQAQLAVMKKSTELQKHHQRSIDASSGMEAKIVAISFVRTDFIGFLNNIRRMASALTRAKEVLILVGSIELFAKCDCPMLTNIAKYYNDHNLVVSYESLKNAVNQIPK